MNASSSIVLIWTSIFLTSPIAASADDTPSSAATELCRLPKHIWLTTMEDKDAKVGWGGFGKWGSAGFENGPITVSNLYSRHGLGAHPDSHVEYHLEKRFKTFCTTAAMDDSALPAVEWPVEFRVLGDGKLLWTSHALHARYDVAPCMLDVTGVDVLRLETRYRPGGSGGQGNAHAVWVEPYVSEDAPQGDVMAYFDEAAFRRIDALAHFKYEVVEHLQKEEFDALEKIADRYREKDDYAVGIPKLTKFYDALATPAQSDDNGWKKRLDLLESWQKAKPDFPTALIALVKAYNNYAWAARGTGWASEVTAERAKLLEERNAKARDYLTKAMAMKPTDPESFHTAIALALTDGDTREAADKAYNEGRKLFPHYFPIYETMANYLLPKWHGQRGDTETYAAQARDDVGGELGDEIYLHMACEIYSDIQGDNFFEGEGFKYKDLLPGIKAALRNYPENNVVFNFCCHAACVGHDKELAARLLPRLNQASYKMFMWNRYGRLDYYQRQYNPVSRAEEIAETRDGNLGILMSVGFRKNGELLCGGGENRLELWRPSADKPYDFIDTGAPVGALALDAAGKFVIVGLGNRFGAGTFANVYEVENGALVSTFKGHKRDVIAVAISLDGKRCGTASKDGTARIWKTEKADAQPLVLKHPEALYDIDFSPDGETVATTSDKGGLWLWNASDGKPQGPPLVEADHGPWFCRVRFFPKSKRLVTAAVDGNVRVCDIATRKFKETRPGGQCTSVAVSPDEKWIAVGGQDGHVCLLKADTFRVERSFEEHIAPVQNVAFSPDGKTLASVAWDGMIKLWPLPDDDPKPITPSSDGSIVLKAVDARLTGSQIILQCDLPYSIGHWNHPGDYPTWKVDVAKAGQFVPEIVYSAPPGCGGDVELSVTAQASEAEKLVADLTPTYGWWDHRPKALPPIHLAAGKLTIALNIKRMNGGDMANVLGIVLKPTVRR